MILIRPYFGNGIFFKKVVLLPWIYACHRIEISNLSVKKKKKRV